MAPASTPGGSFPEWRVALAHSFVPPDAQLRFAEEIALYLGHCRSSRAAMERATAERYVAANERRRPWARMAVLWFLRLARTATADTPAPAAPVSRPRQPAVARRSTA